MYYKRLGVWTSMTDVNSVMSTPHYPNYSAEKLQMNKEWILSVDVAKSSSISKQPHYLYDNHIHFFLLLKYCGLLPIERHNGEFRFRLWRPVSVYTMSLVAFFLGVCFFTWKLIASNLMTESFDYQTTVLYATFFTTPAMNIIPLTAFIESHKVAHFLNSWGQFQVVLYRNHFLEVTGKKLTRPSSKSWIAFPVSLGIVSSLLFMVCYQIMGTMFTQHKLNNWQHVVLLSEFGPASIMFCSYLYLWTILMGSTRLAADKLFAQFERAVYERSTSRKEFNDLVMVWYNLRDLCSGVGDSLGLTYLYFCAIMFMIALFTIYAGALFYIDYRNFSTMSSGVCCLSFITLVAEFSHRATDKVGKQFQGRLINLASSAKNLRFDDDLLKFLQAMDSGLPSISLLGFFTLDRGINLTLYSSLATYIIIIVQFGTMDMSNKSSLQNATTVSPYT